MRLILGSQSPRRREILRYFLLPFDQVASQFEESLVPFEGDPVGYATHLSEAKAASLAPLYPDAILLTADTIVFKKGKVFNKPANKQENFEMLREFNGSWHSVFTAVTAVRDQKKMTVCEETRILFNQLSDEELLCYHRAFSGLDKAGGYSVQMGGGVIVKKMEGCFHNALGLPLNGLHQVLKEVGIDLWHYLYQTS